MSHSLVLKMLKPLFMLLSHPALITAMPFSVPFPGYSIFNILLLDYSLTSSTLFQFCWISIGFQLYIVLNTKFSCSLCTAWVPGISVNRSSLTPQLIHYAPLILVFSVSLDITLLHWRVDHSVLLHPKYGTLRCVNNFSEFKSLLKTHPLSFVSYILHLFVFLNVIILNFCCASLLCFILFFFFSLVLMFFILVYYTDVLFSNCIFTVKHPRALGRC